MTIANYLISKARQTPYWHLDGYMDRYWLVPYKKAGSQMDIGCGKVSWLRRPLARLLQTVGVAVRVHNILRSDDDRAFHDHPWPYLTIILKGGYFEVQPVFDKSGLHTGIMRTWRGPGSIMLRGAKSWHRLEVDPAKDCWTLFCTGKQAQQWGFLANPKAKVHYREFLGLDKDD